MYIKNSSLFTESTYHAEMLNDALIVERSSGLYRSEIFLNEACRNNAPRGTLWAVSECEVWRYGLLFWLLIAGIVLAKGERHSVLKECRVAVCQSGELQKRNVSKRYAHVL